MQHCLKLNLTLYIYVCVCVCACVCVQVTLGVTSQELHFFELLICIRSDGEKILIVLSLMFSKNY